MKMDRFLSFGGVPVRFQVFRPLGDTKNRVALIASPLLSIEQYDRIIPSLQEKGNYCVVCDFPGFGPSSVRDRVSIEQAANMLWGVLDEIDKEEGGRLYCWHLVGHGLSCRAVYEMIRLSPGSVASMAMLCPVFTSGRALKSQGFMRFVLRAVSGRGSFARAARFLYGKKLPEKEWMPLRRNFNRPGVRENIISILSQESDPQENALFAPQMVIWCGRDAVLGGQISPDIKKRLPDGEYHTLPTAGHVPMYTHAGAVRDYLRGWLGSNGS